MNCHMHGRLLWVFFSVCPFQPFFCCFGPTCTRVPQSLQAARASRNFRRVQQGIYVANLTKSDGKKKRRRTTMGLQVNFDPVRKCPRATLILTRECVFRAYPACMSLSITEQTAKMRRAVRTLDANKHEAPSRRARQAVGGSQCGCGPEWEFLAFQ